jgi:hypothetical protein
MLTTTTDLYLRRGAGTQQPSLAVLPAGLRVEQLDQLGAWIQVRTPDGAVGWCSGAYLRPDAPPPGALPLPDLYSPAAGLGSALGRHARLPMTAGLSAWQALELLDVEHNARYRPAENKTYCNIYATDFAHACGYFLPRTWWLESAIDRFRAGHQVAPVYSATVVELNANALHVWMEAWGAAYGWRRVSTAGELQSVVNAGRMGLITAARSDPTRSGHITVCLPEHGVRRAAADDAGEVIGPLQSQAGTTNRRFSTSVWWSGKQFRTHGFWVRA